MAMANPIVPELDVLIASVRYLWGRGAKPNRMSISSGSRAGREEDQQRLTAALETACIPACPISGKGADIVASSATELWHVECKGSPASRENPENAARFGTHRNQFDRALASVVSYYDEAQEGNGPEINSYLGLAVPITDHYVRELKRAGKRLRALLNLWVLLYDAKEGRIVPVEPGGEYPV
jgi:hypothetical protein